MEVGMTVTDSLEAESRVQFVEGRIVSTGAQERRSRNTRPVQVAPPHPAKDRYDAARVSSYPKQYQRM